MKNKLVLLIAICFSFVSQAEIIRIITSQNSPLSHVHISNDNVLTIVFKSQREYFDIGAEQIGRFFNTYVSLVPQDALHHEIDHSLFEKENVHSTHIHMIFNDGFNYSIFHEVLNACMVDAFEIDSMWVNYLDNKQITNRNLFDLYPEFKEKKIWKNGIKNVSTNFNNQEDKPICVVDFDFKKLNDVPNVSGLDLF